MGVRRIRENIESVETQMITNDKFKKDKSQPHAGITKGIRDGQCGAGICGTEPACINVSNTTYKCVCPHDNSLATKDNKCPNRRTVPLTPNRIPIIIPETKTSSNNSTTLKITTLAPPAMHIKSGVLGAFSLPIIVSSVVGFIIIILFLILALIFYGKFRKRALLDVNKARNNNNIGPVRLNRALLDPDKYSTNPNYVPSSPEPNNLEFPVKTLLRSSITFSNVIGEGCFGKVYKGEMQEENKEFTTIAVKILKDAASKEAEDDFMREVEIMAPFKHPNILSLLGVVPPEEGKGPWMVFEFMAHGDLTEVLRSNSKTFWKPDSTLPKLTKDSLLAIATQISHGMQYLAEQHFVHRDLACRNCLVGTNLVVKIADFGMSRDVYTCDYYKIGGSRMLPVRWMSPESITYGRFTLESDVWSYGIVLWEIYSLGKQPYYGRSNEEALKLILQGVMLHPPEDCPLNICDLMKLCWKTEPRDRITFEGISDKLKQMKVTPEPLSHPRPPPFTVTPSFLNNTIPELPEIEVEDYLTPEPAPQKKSHDYIQPLPD